MTLKPTIPPLYFHGIDIPLKDRENIILKPKIYLYSPPGGVVPAASTTVNQDEVHILPDADFMLSAWFLAAYPAGVPFSVLITDSTGYEIYSNFVQQTVIGNNILPTFAPAVFCVPHAIPAAGKIYISIQVAARVAGQAALQIGFAGMSVYRPKGIVSLPRRRVA